MAIYFKGTIKEIAATMIKRVLFRNEFYKKRAFNEFICNEKVIPFDSVDKCSVLISGSDQIWNGKLVMELIGIFIRFW